MTKNMPKKKPKKTTLRLIFMARYTRRGVSVTALKDMLSVMVKDALNNGTITQDTPATIDEHTYTIKEVK